MTRFEQTIAAVLAGCLLFGAVVLMAKHHDRVCQNHSVLWSVEHGDREQRIICQ